MTLTILPVLAAVVAAITIGWVFFRLTGQRSASTDPVARWQQVDPRRYAPLARLLAPEDFAYLRTLPGYHPRLERNLRLRRLDAFRYYLSELIRDFEALQQVGALLITAGQASPLLREQLFLARVSFTRALWQVRLEMLMFRLSGRAVSASLLLTALRDACGALEAPPQPALEA
jgi:hypothetical protein